MNYINKWTWVPFKVVLLALRWLCFNKPVVLCRVSFNVFNVQSNIPASWWWGKNFCWRHSCSQNGGAAPQSCKLLSGLPHHEIYSWLPTAEVKRSALPLPLISCFPPPATLITEKILELLLIVFYFILCSYVTQADYNGLKKAKKKEKSDFANIISIFLLCH